MTSEGSECSSIKTALSSPRTPVKDSSSAKKGNKGRSRHNNHVLSKTLMEEEEEEEVFLWARMLNRDKAGPREMFRCPPVRRSGLCCSSSSFHKKRSRQCTCTWQGRRRMKRKGTGENTSSTRPHHATVNRPVSTAGMAWTTAGHEGTGVPLPPAFPLLLCPNVPFLLSFPSLCSLPFILIHN